MAQLMKEAEIEKLLMGQQASGVFSKVQIDANEERESCVMRLGDLDPNSFFEKYRNKSQPVQRNANRKQQVRQEIARSFRLQDKLTSVVAIAKQRLAKSPQGKRQFNQIVEDFHLKGQVADSSDDEGHSFDRRRERKRQRARSKHQQNADQRLRQKLVRMGKIKDVKEL